MSEERTFEAVRKYVRAKNTGAAPVEMGKLALEIRMALNAWSKQSAALLGYAVFGEACRLLLDARIDPTDVGLEKWKTYLVARGEHAGFLARDTYHNPMSGWFAFQNGAVFFVDHLAFAEAVEIAKGDWHTALKRGLFKVEVATTNGRAATTIVYQAAVHEWVLELDG